MFTLDCASSHRFCYECVKRHWQNQIKNEVRSRPRCNVARTPWRSELRAQKRIPSCLMCEYMVMPHEVKQVFGAGDILDVRAPAPLSLPPGPARDRAAQPSLRLFGIFRWNARSFISKSRWRISSAQAVATTSAARPPAASRRSGSRSACVLYVMSRRPCHAVCDGVGLVCRLVWSRQALHGMAPIPAPL